MKTFIIVVLLLIYSTCDFYQGSNSGSSTSNPELAFDTITRIPAPNMNTAIRNAQSTAVIPTRSIDSIFSRLPSINEIDQIILSGNSFNILNTIQTIVSDDTIPCDQIVSYLLEMTGRIRAAIQKKQFAIDQLRIIIDAARAEIARLEAEIQRLEGQRASLWLDEMRDQLRNFIAQLEPLYKQFNEVESQIAPNEAKVSGYEKEIFILQQANDAEKNRIKNDNLKLIETQARIRDLQNQLNSARDTEAALQTSISRANALIAENQGKIPAKKAAIDELEQVIRRLRGQADAIRDKITELEVRVEKTRTDISVAQNDNLANQIDDLRNRIVVEKTKIVDSDYENLVKLVDSLIRVLPTVQRESQRQYYFCYGEGAVQTTQAGGVLAYVIRGESFVTYLQSAYGQSVNVVPGGVRAADYMFYPSNIFSAAWTSAFGYPFDLSDLNTGNNSFANDFNCLNPSQLQSSQGTITGISGRNIFVTGNFGNTYTLNLGACTRMESSSTIIPQVGQQIVFKGVPSNKGYNTYAISCW